MSPSPLLRPCGAFLLAALIAPPPLASQAHDPHPGAPTQSGQEVPLLDNLGTHHYAISTASPQAQAYFDQGLRLYYAFNHQEAIRSFREAQRIDPDCAMCWWGEALAWGPNINLPMDSASAVAARAAADRALELRDGANERERALIDALSERYAPAPGPERAALDSAWARATTRLSERYPDDDEILVLRGEAVMDLRPWDYWTEEGELHPGIPEALEGFERVLARNPDHPGACHFFIHAVEKVQPERAVSCAERLASLMPGAGHLVHMPGHIYIRVGRYEDAIEANRHAVHADETYIQDVRPGMGIYTAGYYPHNYDFMAFAAAMVGRGDLAVESAEKVASLLPRELFGAPGMTFLQHYATRHLQLKVGFSRWQDVLDAPAPADDLPHALAMWRYARGRALAAGGDLAGAEAELAQVREAARALEGVRLEFNGADTVLEIAAAVLAGHIARARGELDEAADHLSEAVRLEDTLLYGEPPEWTIPTRHELGAVLLAAGRPEEAERVWREALDRFPENGWSLHGLADALEAQGRTDEARGIDQRFRKVWAEADFELGR